MQPVERPFDIVVTTNSGYPLDQNLYQAVKGMSAAAKIVRPGGTIICAAECRDGLPDHGSTRRSCGGGDARGPPGADRRLPGHVPDQWQVQIQARVQAKARVLLRTDGLSDEQVRAAHLEPIADVARPSSPARRRTRRALGVLPQGPQTIPYLA